MTQHQGRAPIFSELELVPVELSLVMIQASWQLSYILLRCVFVPLMRYTTYTTQALLKTIVTLIRSLIHTDPIQP